jgi:hypothetical protein
MTGEKKTILVIYFFNQLYDPAALMEIADDLIQLYNKISVGKHYILLLFRHRSPFDSFSSPLLYICEKIISEFQKNRFVFI